MHLVGRRFRIEQEIACMHAKEPHGRRFGSALQGSGSRIVRFLLARYFSDNGEVGSCTYGPAVR